MKQLELFEITPEEKRYLELIKSLEDKSNEIDLLQHQLISLRSKLKERIKAIDLRFSPLGDLSNVYNEDQEYAYVASTQEEYLEELSYKDFLSLERDKNTKIH